ncbi:class F sortase [Candidatus Roizmanbacteria bacterium]|nr:class F sortase [Candidatus Roizmanbacteria bacterium]
MTHILLIIGILFSLVGSVFFARQQQAPIMVKSAVQTVTPTPTVAFTPSRLVIPKISLDTGIVVAGLDAEGLMEVPENGIDVSWYKYGARPGDKGSAVIAGHFDTKKGAAVFNHLNLLEPGDEIEVLNDLGKLVKYVVFDKRLYPVSEFPVAKIYNNADNYYLNLITCAGVFDPLTSHYSHRTVIFSKLVN